jgi:hypothetical protein
MLARSVWFRASFGRLALLLDPAVSRSLLKSAQMATKQDC